MIRLIQSYIQRPFLRVQKPLHVLVLIFSLIAAILFAVALFNLIKLTSELNQLHREVTRIEVFLPHKPTEQGSILTGILPEPEDNIPFVPLAVVIDNDTNARPHRGLVGASVVFEFPVEGGVTRLLGLYDPGDTVSAIGPVRSVRPYIIDFAAGLGALLAHSGGSPEALRELDSSDGVIAVDEIGPEGRYFWRDRALPGPYNLFTSVNLLQKARTLIAPGAIDAADYSARAWLWQRSLPAGPSRAAGHKFITIDYSTKSYEVLYTYDEKTEQYIRSVGGVKQNDTRGEPIVANNILIAKMETTVIDDEGRLHIEVRGEGEAVVCMQGMCVEARWQKGAQTERIRFFVQSQEVALIPGKTWINIVPIGRSVRFE